MDLASVIGIVACLVMIIFRISVNDGLGAILNFLDLPSVIITLGGALFCVADADFSVGDGFFSKIVVY